MRNAFALVVALCAAAAVGAATYKWVDKDGKVHYSDQAPVGVNAEKVELPKLTELEALPVPKPASQSSEPVDGTLVNNLLGRASSPVRYSSLTITHPAAGETLHGVTSLGFAVALDPPLAGEDRVEYELDGQAVGPSVGYLERGSHTLSVKVVGPGGVSKIVGGPVTFFVHQTIAKPDPTVDPKKP